MGLAITHHIRDQQSYSVENKGKFDIRGLPDDMQQDYKRADEATRILMREMWGLNKV